MNLKRRMHDALSQLVEYSRYWRPWCHCALVVKREGRKDRQGEVFIEC
jgi:hypothetical protein